ncbi:MAG: hypothetical protein A2015_03265 [Spirochaetes bacterium GWF1_31_7]|nr:MAG: hypothetical protein A2Y30_07350 [Spirochaetes bacterium GWE1_32_154]OHD50877.1 MAG: hypothetical protein A2015_03265 [Spirochaetes bacterium GWF1_31_7]HBD96412.1 hypothetical protein [Spirochaetia bacterium]HBI38230.1 hypothetical protein [Spirochaetia bacterium]
MGSEIKGYSVLGKIAKGGMGEVYKAVHLGLGKEVILKKLAAKAPSSFYDRFKREATIMMDISHPNIVHMYDYFKDTGSSYIAMEYIAGYNLSEIVKKIGKLPIFMASYIALEIAKGLDYAHKKGVIHRDIKPGNVLISIEGNVKLTDFGIAFKTDSHTDDNMTKTGTVLGTPAYMSPEQIKSSKDVDVKSDLYSLGVLFYEMLSGKRPFANEFTIENLRVISKGKYDKISKYNKNVPDALIKIIKKLMHHDKSKRFKSALEFIEAINKFIKYSFPDTSIIQTTLASIVNDTYKDDDLYILNYPTSRLMGDWSIKIFIVLCIFFFLFNFIKLLIPDLFFLFLPSHSYGIVNFEVEKPKYPGLLEIYIVSDTTKKSYKIKSNNLLSTFLQRNKIFVSDLYSLHIYFNNTVYTKNITIKPYSIIRNNKIPLKIVAPPQDEINYFINVFDIETRKSIKNYRTYYRISGTEKWILLTESLTLENDYFYDFYTVSNGYNTAYLHKVEVSRFQHNLILNFSLTPKAALITINVPPIEFQLKINAFSLVYDDKNFTKTTNLRIKESIKTLYLRPGVYQFEFYNKKKNITLKKELKINTYNDINIQFSVDNEKDIFVIIK